MPSKPRGTKPGPGLKIGGIHSDAVAAATGRSWADWLRVLDKAGAKKLGHKEIVALVRSHGVGMWWQQMVTVGYEQARGLREKHQVAGGYQVSASRTLPVPIATAYAAWKDPRRRAAWLSDPAFTLRRATRNRSLRITWDDGRTNVEVMFYAKPGGKCMVTVQHNKLASSNAAATMKAYWKKQLAELAGKLSAE